MPPASRFLESSSASSPPVVSPDTVTVDSDVVVILAALLCALICVVGLALVARCAWLRRSFSAAEGDHPNSRQMKGLKKKALRSLPTTSFDEKEAARGVLADCPICLTEFVQGDEIRILPHCGHGFHVNCVDTWLGSHSSCPSCRQILAVGAPSRCQCCGAIPAAGGSLPEVAAPSASVEGWAKAREDGDGGNFLP